MNKRCIASEAPAGRRLMSQAPGWAWRRQVATVLLFVYGCLPLLPRYALAAPPPPPDHTSFAVASLKGNTPALSELPTYPSPLAGLTAPAAPEASLGSARLASLPQHGDGPPRLPPSILPPPVGATAPSHVTALGRLPLAFIENKGQVDARARFYVRSGGQTVWLTSEGLRFDLLRAKGGAATRPETPSLEPRHPTPASPPQPPERERLVFAQDFLDTAKQPTIEARNPLPGIYNFFLGNDPAKWRTEVKGYAELIYREVWDGIDLKLYGNGRALEQEFIVRPGGDLSRIKVAYRGIEGLRVAQDGSLLITTAFGTLKESPPRIYQEIEGKRVEVAGRFKLLGATAYTFEVGPYRPQYALVIDPTLVYSTYLGGSIEEGWEGWWGPRIAVDASGNAYVTGQTTSSDFPTTPGAFQRTLAGAQDAFVTKLNPTGSALVYSTYLGGSDYDYGYGIAGIAVDASGNAYVMGQTTSSDFPTTPGAFQRTLADGSDAFVTKLNPTGSALVYSTYLGGSDSDYGRGIAVDASGNVYVTGGTFSSDFPTTPGAFQRTLAGAQDAFVTKLNPTGSALVYSTYLGAATSYGIAVDASGNAYVTGSGWGGGPFPTTPGAFQRTLAGGGDAFVTKLNPTGSALVYSTYLGGSAGTEGGTSIAVDGSGNAYVTGPTFSSDFPTTPGAFQRTLAGATDAFVTKLNPTGSALVYSTYLGGTAVHFMLEGRMGRGIAVDGSGNAYVTGGTPPGFPTTPGAFQQSTYVGGNNDVYVTKLNPTGSALVYSTYLGGSDYDYDWGTSIAVDGSGNVYVTGGTFSSSFPTTPGAFQRTLAGATQVGGDAFVARFDFGTLALSAFTITVTKSGAGSGTVTSSPAGIDCGATCSASYASGTTVSLTATPDSGSTFTGWGGDCDGQGTPCSLTMTTAKSVTATFNNPAVPVGGLTSSSPAAVLEGSTLHLFVRGTDGALYLNSRSGSTFGGWSEVPGGGLTSNQPAAVLDSGGSLRLYVQGADNGLWVNTKSGSTWSGWSAVGGGKSSSGPAVVLDGSSMRLVVRGLDDGIWTALADNPQWTSLGGRTFHSPAAVLEGSTLHVFVRGTDGALYLNSRSGGSFGGWSAVPGGGQSSSQPAALLDGSSALRLYVQGADNGLWVNTKSGSTWSGWSAVGGGKSSSGPAVVSDGSAVRLVVRGLDDQIYIITP